MIFIYKKIIKNYINHLTIDDIKNYAKKQNEIITEKEANIIYEHIKKYQNELLNHNTSSFKILKENLRNDLFQKITLLYNETYDKYKFYLQN